MLTSQIEFTQNQGILFSDDLPSMQELHPAQHRHIANKTLGEYRKTPDDVNLEKAYFHAEKALELDRSPRSLYALAALLEVDGEKDDAIALLSEALDIEPDNQHCISLARRCGAYVNTPQNPVMVELVNAFETMERGEQLSDHGTLEL